MKIWTSKEIQYVKKNALLAETNEVLNVKEIAKRLERTENSIRNKIYSLQRSGDLPAVDKTKQRDASGRLFSLEEDKRMLSMYKQGATCQEIGQALGREETAITGRIYRLRKKGKIRTRKRTQWTEAEKQLLIERVHFDETGHVDNYEELMQLLSKGYQQIVAKVSRLRKEGQISILAQEGTTSTKSREAMARFNDSRFARIPKEKESLSMNDFSIESKQVSLILTTIITGGQRIEQYFTQTGQVIATKKEPISRQVETGQRDY
ncbi:MAG: helix-turn-helix domain containing protein [Enterococcus avium]